LSEGSMNRTSRRPEERSHKGGEIKHGKLRPVSVFLLLHPITALTQTWPTHGEHTTNLLAELSCSPEKILALESASTA
jgi:hypothetical protein